jgi:peptide methionine sulfoxide reductase MsrA
VQPNISSVSVALPPSCCEFGSGSHVRENALPGSDTQKLAIDQAVEVYRQASGKSVATDIQPMPPAVFWEAEAYHQVSATSSYI